MALAEGCARRCAVALLVALLAGPAAAEPVAITFDDLPILSPNPRAPDAEAVTRRLTRALQACRAPVTGFVVGATFEDQPQRRRMLLAAWRRAGFALGNHTYSHDSLNALSAEAYVADIARDDVLLRSLDRRRNIVRWFRHPFLETGDTTAKRQVVEAWLDAHGYRVAPVTLENDDDLFAAPYEDALRRGDHARALRIRKSYLAFTASRIAWYRDAAKQLLGRRPAQVFLMHASRLNADSALQLCRLLRRDGLTPVSLAHALLDPAFSISEGPPTPDGDDWLNRWSGVLGKDLPWDSFPEVPAEIRAEAARLDPDTH